MKVPFLDLKAQYESIKDEINQSIQNVLDSCAFAGGPFVEEFEKNFAEFCQVNFGTTLTLFDKVDVNGVNAHPLFEFLKEQCPGLLGSKAIKWNFTKFLVDEKGVPVKRYAPKDSPDSIRQGL